MFGDAEHSSPSQAALREALCPQSAAFCDCTFCVDRPTPTAHGVQSTTAVASKVLCCFQARNGDSCQPPPPIFLGDAFVRRDELLKPDVLSEVILLGASALVFAILILILVVVLTQVSAPI
jgi:hypothetical protein